MSLFQRIVVFAAALLALVLVMKLFQFSANADHVSGDEGFQKNFNNNYKIFALNLPDQLDFSGEAVPLDLLDVREKLDRELLINTYWQSQSLLFHKRANRYFPVIEPILAEHGVPDDFKYLAIIESGLQNVVSPAGATGFWQFMKPTAIEYGLEVNGEVDERYHLEKSTVAACKYIKDAYKRYGSWTMAAASYNMGMNGLDRQVARQKVSNYYDLLLTEETARYLFRILSAKEILSSPQKYGFQFRKKDLYPPLKTKTVTVDQPVPDFADFAFEHGVNYKILKLLNPWLRDSFLKNTGNKTYEIKLPASGFSGLIPAEEIGFEQDSLMQDTMELNTPVVE